ncbi:hypothetical protein CU098_008053 [Rhizopus stolonifer]|uniref:Uncharacterized protein n=1 Tax=Rhizopus stolonifer TaxID=4846 RepID=A0A367K2S1_RHIST|nr:hypothetical protein CU098_008053 [Rhizopus stolonifer]
MLPTLGWIAYDTLSSHPVVQSSKCVEKGLKDLGHQLSQFSWEAFSQGKVTFDTILDCVRHQESIMCHAISLTRKLPRQFQLVDQLLCHDQVIVQEGQERSAVFELFKSERNGIGEPSFREYILFSDCKDLRTRDQLVLPFRQYALVKDNEIRIVDMQSTDTLYI